MTIYEYLGISPSEHTFKRDYIQNPLRKIIVRPNGGLQYEEPDLDDVRYLYITLNKSTYEMNKIMGYKISRKLKKWCNKREYMRTPKLSKEELYNMIYVQKIPMLDIARKFNYKSNVPIIDWLDYYNIHYKSPYYADTKISKEELYDCYKNKNMTVKGISKKFNVGEATIQIMIMKNGLKKSQKEISLSTFKQRFGDFAYELLTNRDKMEQFIKDNKIKTIVHMADLLKLSTHNCSNMIKANDLQYLFNINCSYVEKKWLDIMGVPDDKEHRQVIIGKYRVDGFIPETNTIYEFYGDYWHGNIKRYNPNKINKYTGLTMQELYDKTIAREKELRDMGYNLITEWESNQKYYKGEIRRYGKYVMTPNDEPN